MNGTHHYEYTSQDFGRNPLMFYYEVTQACDLVCKHCRASAQEEPHPGELSTEQAKALIDQVATFPRRPMHRAYRRRPAEAGATCSS